MSRIRATIVLVSDRSGHRGNALGLAPVDIVGGVVRLPELPFFSFGFEFERQISLFHSTGFRFGGVPEVGAAIWFTMICELC